MTSASPDSSSCPCPHGPGSSWHSCYCLTRAVTLGCWFHLYFFSPVTYVLYCDCIVGTRHCNFIRRMLKILMNYVPFVTLTALALFENGPSVNFILIHIYHSTFFLANCPCGEGAIKVSFMLRCKH